MDMGMGEEKVVCSECGWSGPPLAVCPNCGGALYRLWPGGIPEDPVRAFPEEPFGSASTRESSEAWVADQPAPVRLTSPEDLSLEWAEKSKQWLLQIHTLARSLAKGVEQVAETLSKWRQIVEDALKEKRQIRTELLQLVRQADIDETSLESVVTRFIKRDGIFEGVPIEQIASFERHIKQLIRDLANARRQFSKKSEEARRLSNEIHYGRGFIVWIIALFLLFSCALLSFPPRNDDDGVALLFITCIPSVLLGAYVALRPQIKANNARSECEILRKKTEEIYGVLEKETSMMLQFWEKEGSKILSKIEAELSETMKAYLAKWSEQASNLRQEMGIWGSNWSGFLDWRPVSQPLAAVRVGELYLQIDLPLPGVQYQVFSLPLLIPFIRGKGFLIMASSENGPELAREVCQSLAFRILASVPPGKLRFIFIDPVGLGNNAAPLLHLKEYDESEEDSLVTSRAWSEPEHIRKQLAKVKDHISTVVQERLRDEYPDIAAYNLQAGEVAVPYRILLVFDFPTNFSEEAAKDLLAIAEIGARAGVFPIIMIDPSKKMPYGFNINALLAALQDSSGFPFSGMSLKGLNYKIVFDRLPAEQLRRHLIDEWGKRAKEGMRIEVPFGKLLGMVGLDTEGSWWKSSTREGFEVPLGPKTAREPQRLVFGRGTAHHGLIVGRTGSGKSNLMHVIISTSILKYPPDELSLYLIDLKSVEFIVYKDVPHVKVLAVDADREFALAVLREVNNEMLRRMEAFRGIANDFTEYRDKMDRNGNKLPRILLIIDEFQVLFEQDDQIASEARLLLDRLARQGRGFGIHLLLGSQSLAGYSLARTTIDQMAVRIALQCSEADSRLVLAEDNPAARRLSRPGQAIYNNTGGLIEGNSEFQVALFGDDDREVYIRRIISLADKKGIRQKPVVFAGNEPAKIEFCVPLIERLKAGPLTSTNEVACWIGESVSVAPPVSVRMSRHAGTHLAVVTREEAEGIGVLMACAISLCAQYPSGRVQLFIADFSTSGTEWGDIAENLEELFPDKVKVIGRKEIASTLESLRDHIRSAIEGERSIETDYYLILAGLQRIRVLRSEDSLMSWGQRMEDSPAAHLSYILQEGPEMGVHVLIWCDTVGNLQRAIDRRALHEIGFRVAGPMSEQDSVQFLDEPHAAKIDKPHRMLYYDMDRPGELEKFRPYVVRDLAWLKRLIGRR